MAIRKRPAGTTKPSSAKTGAAKTGASKPAADKSADVKSEILSISPMGSVLLKRTVNDGNGNFFSTELMLQITDKKEIDKTADLINGKLEEIIEKYSGFDAATDEGEEYDEEGGEEEYDEEGGDEDGDELTEEMIMAMKKPELVQLIEEEELEIDVTGMKLKDIREEIIACLFAEDEEDSEEYDEEFDGEEEDE